MDTAKIDEMLSSYIECALWSPFHQIGAVPLHTKYGPADLDAATLAKMRADCIEFANANAVQIEQYGGMNGAWEQAGEDLWLTRNGQSVGFWTADRDWPNDGQDLTVAAEAMGESQIGVNDAGHLYIY